MGFLNDIGLDKVEADPNYIGDGRWPGWLTDSKIVEKKDGNTAWVITYKIDKDSTQYAGRTQDEWYPLSDATDTNKAWMKKRVLGLGVPESKINDLDPGDVAGLCVYITIRHKGSYQNVVDVVLRDEATGNVIAGATPTEVSPTEAMEGAAMSTPQSVSASGQGVSNLM